MARAFVNLHDGAVDSIYPVPELAADIVAVPSNLDVHVSTGRWRRRGKRYPR